jgi:SAM-dependent methyltransferase
VDLRPKVIDDRSNGYEALASEHIARRRPIGAKSVRVWAQSLPHGSAVLDLGCGDGIPISKALIEEALDVYGVDASPSMVAAFGRHFPRAPAACEPAEESTFFGRSFDGIVAWGLMFLLPADTQRVVISKVAAALKPGGRFLFTAGKEAVTWPDALTGRPSVSLGADAYRSCLSAAGLVVVAEHLDEGDNYYYEAAKR